MNRDERDTLYDWLENGRVDVFLRRLMRERLEELEVAVARVEPDADVLRYAKPDRRHGGWLEALGLLRHEATGADPSTTSPPAEPEAQAGGPEPDPPADA